MKAFLLFFLSTVILAYPNSGKAAEPSEITHSFLVCGQKTYIMAEDGKASWTYPDSTRDGYVIENGNLILTLSFIRIYPPSPFSCSVSVGFLRIGGSTPFTPDPVLFPLAGCFSKLI